MQQRLLEQRQFGVARPGGVEELVHFRRLLERAICADARNGAWAIIDADFENCFRHV
jgi:hypothetical protein